MASNSKHYYLTRHGLAGSSMCLIRLPSRYWPGLQSPRGVTKGEFASEEAHPHGWLFTRLMGFLPYGTVQRAAHPLVVLCSEQAGEKAREHRDGEQDGSQDLSVT